MGRRKGDPDDMPTGHEDGGRKGTAVYLRALLGRMAHVRLSPDHPRRFTNDPSKIRDHRHDGERGFSQVAKQARQISPLFIGAEAFTYI